MKKIYAAVLLVLAVVIIYSVFIGSKNKIDPLWIELSEVIQQKPLMLSESEEVLNHLFDSLHTDLTVESAMDLINRPFLPTMKWEKFESLTNKILEDKKVIVLGASGVGKTTIIDRVAQIISGKKENIIKIECSEGLEQDYNRQWVGFYNGAKFEPGLLLDLFKRCEQNALQKYVLIIDDFDKIYRTTFFGSTIWSELDNASYDNFIRGYEKEIEIPDNLYIISVGHPGNSSRLPLASEDYRRLSNGGPYMLEPSMIELRDYLLDGKTLEGNPTLSDSILHRVYYFSKINEIIEEKVGVSALIGQWSNIRKILRRHDFTEANSFIKAHLAKYEAYGKLDETDYSRITYSINNQGKLEDTNVIATSFINLVQLGIFSELTVALIFAAVSAIGLRRSYLIRKKNLDTTLIKLEGIVQDYQLNKIKYPKAYGDLLLIKDQIHLLAKKGKLNFAEANFLMIILKDILEQVDFIHDIGDKSTDLKLFMKEVLADDLITRSEYSERMKFLNSKRSEIDHSTFCTIQKQLVKLYYKSRSKTTSNGKGLLIDGERVTQLLR